MQPGEPAGRPTPDFLAQQVAAYWTQHGQPASGAAPPTPAPWRPPTMDVPFGPLAWALPAAAVWWAWRTGRLPALPFRPAGWPLFRGERAARARCRWQGRDWLIRGVLPDAFGQRSAWWPLLPDRKRAYLAVLAGEEGSGKSYLLVYLAVCCVLGVDFLGVPTRRLSAVVYADSELDAATFWQRVAAVVAGLRLPDPHRAFRRCRRRLAYVCLRDHGETLYVPSEAERQQGRRPAGQERIRRTVRRQRAELALVDGLTTGSGASPGDEAAAGRLVLGLETLGCAVVAIDHTNASGQQAGSAHKRRLERVKYLLTRVGKGRTDDGRRRLVIDKASFTGKDQELRYVCTHHDGEAGELGAVTFTTLPPERSPTVTTAPSPDPDSTPTVDGHRPSPPGGANPPQPSPVPPLPGNGNQPSSGRARGPMRPRLPGPSGGVPHPAPSTQDAPFTGVGPGVGVGVGATQGAADRVTQPRARGTRRAAPDRKAYPLILAAVQRRGPGADVLLDDLAAELRYAPGTIGNRTRELKAMGKLGCRVEGTVCLPDVAKEAET